MPYNSVITRSDAQALIPEDVNADILQHIPQTSAVLGLARRLPNMPRAQRRMPVLSALATAYFVNGDTGLKQTTEVDWSNKYLDAEEIACIVPIPEAVLDDTSYPVWSEVRPLIEEALGVAIDQAVLYGTNIPATWTTNLGGAGLIAGATSASQVISNASYADLYEAIFGEDSSANSGLFGLVEEDGFMVTGNIAHLTMKRRLRNMRSTTGDLLFNNNPQVAGRYILDGADCIFPTNGAVSSTYWLISGQWDQLVYAVRQDVTYKILDQAVIQDNAGNIIYNLAQQDMVALRAVIRVGVALPNPINRVQPTEANRYPFAALTA